MPRPARTAEEIETMRGRILEAACQAVQAGGPAAVTMRRVAERLGVSHMTLYTYFANREALLSALRAEHLAQMDAHRRQQLARAQSGEVVAVLREELGHYVEMARQRPEVYRLVFVGMVGDYAGPDGLPLRSRLLSKAGHLTELIRIGIEQGVLPQRDPQVAALTALTVVNGPLIFHLSGRLPDGAPTEAVIAEVLDLAMAYLTGG
jgi:AcrR family transcriptional regulator